MIKEEFRVQFAALLDETLDTGPGPRAVGRIAAATLADFVLSEAGAFAPQAIEEIVAILRKAITDVEAEAAADGAVFPQTTEEALEVLKALGFVPANPHRASTLVAGT